MEDNRNKDLLSGDAMQEIITNPELQKTAMGYMEMYVPRAFLESEEVSDSFLQFSK